MLGSSAATEPQKRLLAALYRWSLMMQPETLKQLVEFPESPVAKFFLDEGNRKRFERVRTALNLHGARGSLTLEEVMAAIPLLRDRLETVERRISVVAGVFGPPPGTPFHFPAFVEVLKGRCWEKGSEANIGPVLSLLNRPDGFSLSPAAVKELLLGSELSNSFLDALNKPASLPNYMALVVSTAHPTPQFERAAMEWAINAAMNRDQFPGAQNILRHWNGDDRYAQLAATLAVYFRSASERDYIEILRHPQLPTFLARAVETAGEVWAGSAPELHLAFQGLLSRPEYLPLLSSPHFRTARELVERFCPRQEFTTWKLFTILRLALEFDRDPGAYGRTEALARQLQQQGQGILPPDLIFLVGAGRDSHLTALLLDRNRLISELAPLEQIPIYPRVKLDTVTELLNDARAARTNHQLAEATTLTQQAGVFSATYSERLSKEKIGRIRTTALAMIALVHRSRGDGADIARTLSLDNQNRNSEHGGVVLYDGGRLRFVELPSTYKGRDPDGHFSHSEAGYLLPPPNTSPNAIFLGLYHNHGRDENREYLGPSGRERTKDRPAAGDLGFATATSAVCWVASLLDRARDGKLDHIRANLDVYFLNEGKMIIGDLGQLEGTYKSKDEPKGSPSAKR